jgi:hypothetical protein
MDTRASDEEGLMYEVWVYHEQYAQFVPVRFEGKRKTYESWNDAELVRIDLMSHNPGEQYKVEFNTIRRPRRKRGY